MGGELSSQIVSGVFACEWAGLSLRFIHPRAAGTEVLLHAEQAQNSAEQRGAREGHAILGPGGAIFEQGLIMVPQGTQGHDHQAQERPIL